MGKFAALAIVAGFVAFYLAIGIGFMVFIGYLIRDHGDARRYRALIREYEASKSRTAPAAVVNGPTWKLTYLNGRKREEVILAGDTEQEALAAAAKQKLRWDTIVSLEKVS